ncbi:hemin uptake protein HemP [Planctomycetaceae bacterium]|nr:hemin uptake protein HemP [Planctomycetaceae bacterium]MDC0262221.1 hemin uptake protein HemP [Planctomycetaceae bacterium]MDC0274430.1 hemin uptake protein HemP [Planctomycetaceae bacterium]MDC0308119.1 hemin uptake protein HemP [Planctomycetaceae bacterium]MDG2391396.1 hemin uptake protein HemP [Planctomycetaceae bacterium]
MRVVLFEDLSHGEKEVMVEYENQHYRLRVTKNGKLILNK